MLHYPVLIEDLIEDVQRTAAFDHEIFGDDFKPVDDRFFFEDMLIVRNTQTNPHPVFRKPVESIRRHKFYEGRKKEGSFTPPGRPFRLVERLSGWLGTIGGATTFSFAGVLALTAVVASFTTAFAFTRVLTLAGMLVFC
jgi:hypothetical protein